MTMVAVECVSTEERKLAFVVDLGALGPGDGGADPLRDAAMRARIRELETEVAELKASLLLPMAPLPRVERRDPAWQTKDGARSLVSASELRKVFEADGELRLPESWAVETAALLEIPHEDAELLLRRLQRNETSLAEDEALFDALEEAADRWSFPLELPPDLITRIKRFVQRCAQ